MGTLVFTLAVYIFLVFQVTLEALDNKTNSSNLYPPTKGYFRETCKSQNINPTYLNPKFTFDIIQTITNACSVC